MCEVVVMMMIDGQNEKTMILNLNFHNKWCNPHLIIDINICDELDD
jgi:hypothetical protein